MNFGRAIAMRPYEHTRLCIKAVVITVILGVTGANADDLSTGQILAACDANDRVLQTACRYFIYGAVEGLRLGDSTVVGANKDMVARNSTHFCIPDNMPQDTMMSVYRTAMKFDLAKYPEDAKLPAISTIDAAMNQMYPCNGAN
jgi:hypothetical protein